MLSTTPGKKRTQYIPDYTVFDLETTGTYCATDAVVEISAVKVRGGIVVDEFSTLVNPMRPIPYWASQINGIYDEMVLDSPTFQVALAAFMDFVGDDVLVGHNIHSFDMKFLYRDAFAFWGMTIGNDYIDTLPLSRQVLPELSHHKLTDLACYCHLSTDGAHRALCDCRMNQQVFEFLGKKMEESKGFGFGLCPKCGQPLKKRAGRYGEFLGCSGYPECKYTQHL